MKALKGWTDRKGRRLFTGDTVEIPKSYAKEHGLQSRRGEIVDLHGFITVRVFGGAKVDFDGRQITKVTA